MCGFAARAILVLFGVDPQLLNQRAEFPGGRGEQHLAVFHDVGKRSQQQVALPGNLQRPVAAISLFLLAIPQTFLSRLNAASRLGSRRSVSRANRRSLLRQVFSRFVELSFGELNLVAPISRHDRPRSAPPLDGPTFGLLRSVFCQSEERRISPP